ALAVGLAVLATLTSGMGLLRWRQADRAMRRGDPLPRHPTPGFLAVGLIVVGLIALAVVITKAVRGWGGPRRREGRGLTRERRNARRWPGPGHLSRSWSMAHCWRS